MFTSIVIAYCIGLLATSSLLLAWTSSNLAIHVLHMLKRLHFLDSSRTLPDGTNIWDGLNEFEPPTGYTWQDWVVMSYSNTTKEMYIAELLTCNICFSFHLSFWVSAVTSLILYWLIPCPYVFLLIPAATFTYPIIANILIKLYEQLNAH